MPAQYPTIAADVAASSAGDHIVLADGVFSGAGNHDITLPVHALTIHSGPGSATDCIIQLEHDIFLGVAQRAFHFPSTSSSQSALQGITIRGGGGDRTGSAAPQADCDSSGELDFFDFLCFQSAFATGCP